METKLSQMCSIVSLTRPSLLGRVSQNLREAPYHFHSLLSLFIFEVLSLIYIYMYISPKLGLKILF